MRKRHQRPVNRHHVALVVMPRVKEKTSAPANPAYRIAAGSALPPQPKPVVYTAPSTTPSVANPNTAAIQSEVNANHEAWQATTERLADVVGVVGQQQSELTEKTEAVNNLSSAVAHQG